MKKEWKGEKGAIKPIRALTFGEALFDTIKGTAHLGGAPPLTWQPTLQNWGQEQLCLQQLERMSLEKFSYPG